MKKITFTIITSLLSFINSFSVMSQSDYYCGTYMPYDTINLASDSCPEGYKPCLINHLGRHGSRYPVSDTNILTMKSILDEAQTQDQLTDNGKLLVNELNQLNVICNNNWGNLTPLGMTQQHELAKRMVSYVGVKMFSNMRVWCDVKERCVQSYDYFMNGLYDASVSLNAKLNKTDLNEENPLLNFYKTNTQYLSFKDGVLLQNTISQYINQEFKNADILPYFIKDASQYPIEKRIEFTLAFFNSYTISANIPFQMKAGDILTEDQKNILWRMDNAKEYLTKGPSPIADNIQIDISLPLLRNFIETSVEGLYQHKYNAYLRFAHAETLIPLIALMDIPEACQSIDFSTDIYKVWKDYELAPMNANLIWIFYKNNQGRILVKMLLNEHEVHFPIPTETFPFYSWSKVRNYYMDKITALQQGSTLIKKKL